MLKFTVFFWQAGRHVSASVYASSRRVAKSIIRQTYAGINITRIEQA